MDVDLVDDDDMFFGFDLNQQPFLDPSPSSPPPPPPPAAPPSPSRAGIVDRIRHLEAVSARANQRQRWRRIMNNPEVNNMPVIESSVGIRNENQGGNGGGGGEVRVRNCKRDVRYLAKALEMDSDGKKIDNGGSVANGNFFDCNICLDMAKDPILTCCGHLFCWSCFYQVPYVDSISKECPACKGEVIDSNITPIYGNGDGNGKNSEVLELESGVKIPPRPKARRVEGVRQQNFGRGVSHIQVADALRRIRIGLGLIEGNSHPPGLINGLVVPVPIPVRTSVPNQPVVLLNSSEAEESRNGVMSDAASLSSISSAINSAERFVQDLETYISGANSNTTSVNIQSEPQPAEMNPISSSRRNLATTVLHMGTVGNDGSLEIDLTISRRASLRRRRASNLEGQSSLELRRRQLR